MTDFGKITNKHPLKWEKSPYEDGFHLVDGKDYVILGFNGNEEELCDFIAHAVNSLDLDNQIETNKMARAEGRREFARLVMRVIRSDNIPRENKIINIELYVKKELTKGDG